MLAEGFYSKVFEGIFFLVSFILLLSGKSKKQSFQKLFLAIVCNANL